MAIFTNTDESTGLRRYTVEGQMTADDFSEALSEVFTHPDYRPASDALWDLRKATGGTFSVREIRGVVDAVAKYRREAEGSRVALVVGSSRAYGLARMYEQMMSVSSPVTIMVFRDMGEAEFWLMGDEGEK